MDYIGIALSFLGSFGLFIFGISLLSSALQKTAGSKMKHILGSISKNRIRGVLFGAGVTALIQSSTATTVMAVGFVNAGIIALPQIVGIIMGANVGTTVTGWLVSSVEWAKFLRPDAIGAVAAAAGALMLLFSKKKKVKNIGEVIVGFGVLFLGLSQMPAAVKPLAELDSVRQMFITMGANPVLGVLAGVLVTGVIQSSAASIGILQSMAFTGMVPWNAAIYIVLGQNIGTCLTAVLSSIGTSKNAQATSYVHLVYNIIGAVIFCTGAVIFFALADPAAGTSMINATGISMIHTGYNIAALLLLFPFGKLILAFAVKITDIGSHRHVTDPADLPELDESILETPSFAIENCTKAVFKLMELVRANLVLGVDIFMNRDHKKLDGFWSHANKIDKANDKISAFLTGLYHIELNKDDTVLVSSLIHIIISLKRISNRTKGFAKLTEDAQDSDIDYSNINTDKLKQIYEATLLCYDRMLDVYNTHDIETISLVLHEADIVNAMREEFKSEHLALSFSGAYSVESGIIFAEAARHMTRIAHNIKSVIESISSSYISVDKALELDECMKRR